MYNIPYSFLLGYKGIETLFKLENSQSETANSLLLTRLKRNSALYTTLLKIDWEYTHTRICSSPQNKSSLSCPKTYLFPKFHKIHPTFLTNPIYRPKNLGNVYTFIHDEGRTYKPTARQIYNKSKPEKRKEEKHTIRKKNRLTENSTVTYIYTNINSPVILIQSPYYFQTCYKQHTLYCSVMQSPHRTYSKGK